MPRSLVLSNQHLQVCLDQYGQMRDLYFPHIGLENHVMGELNRIGFLIDHEFTWISHPNWQVEQHYLPQTLAAVTTAKHKKGIAKVEIVDRVLCDSHVFLREINWHNQSNQVQEVKVFFHQVFFISEGTKRNTAFFDPTHQAVIHYKGKRAFLCGGSGMRGAPISEYSVGAYQEDDKEGTFKDAEDGVLSRNAVEHGNVDSVVALSLKVNPGQTQSLYYWYIAGQSLTAVCHAQKQLLQKTPHLLIAEHDQYWQDKLNQLKSKISNLEPKYQELAERSFEVLWASTDFSGGVIASPDSDTLQYGKDDYSYFWPRDGMYIINTLIAAGEMELAKKYLLFCQKILHEDGYLHHRYRLDGSVGSTWHSSVEQSYWLADKRLQLPIQEDETAGVLITFWRYYQQTQDLSLVKTLGQSLIVPICEFLLSYINPATKLPLPSYDIWEEKLGVSTYTTSVVVAAMQAGAKLCELNNWPGRAKKLQAAAEKMRESMLRELYSETDQRFIRSWVVGKSGLSKDKTIDSSVVFGLWYFGITGQGDAKFDSTWQQIKAGLNLDPNGIGFIRYQNDKYFTRHNHTNYWYITTLWEAQRRLYQEKVTEEDFNYVRQVLDFVIAHQTPTGLLGEQVDPQTGENLSATPLGWSHAVVLETIFLLARKSQTNNPA